MEQNALSRKITVASLMSFAMPTVAMMVFMNLYTMVDGVFISRLVGIEALSAVNLVYPFIMLVMTVGIMLSAGGSAVIARKMGEGRQEEANRNFSMLILLGVVIGFTVLLLGKVFLPSLVQLLGANETVLPYCILYLSTLLPFMPCFVLQILFQGFFVTAGHSGLGLGAVALGGVTNILLDYVFVYSMGWGIAGAAVATGIGYSVPGLIGLFYFTVSQRKGCGLRLVRPVIDGKVLLHVVANGSSEMVTNLAGSVTMYLFNITMMRLLGADGVAAITIILYTDAILVAIYFGYSMGTAPLISYNYGEGNEEKLKRIKKISFSALAVFGVAVLLAAVSLASPMAAIFSGQGTPVYHLVVEGLPKFSIAYLFMGINIFASAWFTALFNGRVSAFISFMRTFVFLVAGILLLPLLWGITGLWFTVPVAEFLSLFVTAYCMKKYSEV